MAESIDYSPRGYFPRRRCGTCRLPGHTKTNCNIYDLSTLWDDPDPEAARRSIYRQRQNEIMARGLKPMTQEEYCQAVYGMSYSTLLEHRRENRALPAPYTRVMKLNSRTSGVNERRNRYQRHQANRPRYPPFAPPPAPPSPTPEQRIPVATSPPPAPTRERTSMMEINIDDESVRVLERAMNVLEQEIQAWIVREHPDMVDVEMDTWFHTTYPDVERRLEDFFYEIASWSQRAHPRPEPPRTSWSQIQPATIATQIVREEPRPEAQVDLSELLQQSMNISYPQAQATQAPPADATVIESEECPICMEAFTGTNHIVGKCGHQFHASCLMQSLRSTDACPCCRQQVV